MYIDFSLEELKVLYKSLEEVDMYLFNRKEINCMEGLKNKIIENMIDLISGNIYISEEI